jgi:hypothetical protein
LALALSVAWHAQRIEAILLTKGPEPFRARDPVQVVFASAVTMHGYDRYLVSFAGNVGVDFAKFGLDEH